MNRPTLTLIATAMFWAAIWWPFRQLAGAGLASSQACLLIFGSGAIAALIAAKGRLPSIRRAPLLLVAALASALCNLGYNLAAIHAPVMKAVLLLYTSPLWTVALAWLLMRERPGARGGIALALCVLGAALMLYHPELGYPWPASVWEWVGLGAGFAFALYNVMTRALPRGDEKERVALIFVVEVLLSALWAAPAGGFAPISTALLALGVATGIAMWIVITAMQWGLQRLPANHAAVLMSSELVFAALLSWWLAGEALSPREGLGATLIACAALASAWQPAPPSSKPARIAA